MTPKIVFLGTPEFALIILKKLITTPFKPILVITGHNKITSRGQALESKSVELETKKHNIRIDYKISAIDKSYDLAILVAYGHIIPEEILKIPKFGFVNVHPSLLPQYRGPSPIQSTLLNGDNQTGVSVMVLDEKLDHGPILAQKKIKIQELETAQSLTQKLGETGANLLIGSLPDFLSGKTKPKRQNHSKAIYTQKITKRNGYIDIKNPPDPKTLSSMIRAFYPWPTVWLKIKVKSEKSKLIKFLPPTIPPTHELTDPFLIQPEGKKPMTIKEFKNGYPKFQKVIEKLIKQ